jgi:hypothetical protein
MMCRRLLLASLLLAVLAGSAPAGIIFGKKGTKPTPAERVAELIATLKSDGDEHKRAAAAEELRQFDAKQFSEILPVLVEALLNDPKPSVRSEAAQSIGKIRPVSKEAGWALEQAVAKDASMRVRLQARSALLHYHWAGYHGGKESAAPAAPAVIQTKEPPLAAPPPAKAASPESPRVQAKPVSQPVVPTPAVPAVNTGNGPRPLPQGPPLVPTDAPRLKPAPASDQGPDLNPPAE